MIFNDSKYNSHWQIKTLSQLGTFSRGKSKHRPRNDSILFENGKYPLIQTGDIKEANIYIKKHSSNYSEYGLQQSKLWDEGTLCITIAANIAETAILGYPMCFPDSVVGFNSFPEESSEIFMHYLFTYIKKTIQNRVQGSIQDNINIEYLSQLEFRIPFKKELDKLTNILYLLDQKIELNNKINFELEAMAKTLYDYWFIQFDFPNGEGKPYKASGGAMKWNDELKREIPVGWHVKELGEVLKRSGTGLNPRKNFVLGKGNNYYVTIKNIKNSKVILNNKCDKIDDKALEIIDKRSNLQKGDILFTSIEPVGITYLIQEKPINWNINESVFTLRPNVDEVSSEYLLMLLSSLEMKAFASNVSAGSIHKGIRHGELKTFKFPYSNKKLVSKFTKIIKPIYEKIDKIDSENRNLTQIRDWLLPMLMNGQITIE